MREGFTFCGTDIADIGLHYAPELEDVFVYKPGETEYHEEVFEGHTGGYFYGANRKPKEIVLRCYFEDSKIDRGIMERTYALFRVGKSGKLVFQRRPWCYYYATVISCEPEYFNYEQGTVKITFKAYYPFARSDTQLCTRTQPYYERIMENTAFFNKEEMVLPTSFSNLTEQTSFLLANGGTERAAVGIAIAGDVGTGVTIANETTGQLCKFVAMSKAVTTDKNKYVLSDGINGKTMLVGPKGSKICFLYHDSGFIDLEPGYPAIRNVYVSFNTTTNIHITNKLYDDIVGKFVFTDSWKKIVAQIDKHNFTVDSGSDSEGTITSSIMSLNELTLTPSTSMDISKLAFIYKPTFA